MVPEVDLPAEQRRVLRWALVAAIVCLCVLAAAVLIAPATLALPAGLAERLSLVVRADVLVVLWVVYAVRRVSRIRFYSAADNAGSAYGAASPQLAVAAAFLQNTLEQAFIAVFAHLALATVPGEAAIAYVIGSVALFCLGRATFWAGYGKGAGGRAFGMVTTVIPTIGAYAWVLIEMGMQAWPHLR